MKYIRIFTLLALVFALGACAPGSETGLPDQAANNAPGNFDSPMPEGVSGTGLVSINLTDAAVDDAIAVVIQFSAVHLIGEGDTESQIFELTSSKAIDLLSLQGSQSEILLENQTVPVGTYGEVRLIIDQSGTYIELTSGTQHELKVPSGEQSGAKIKFPEGSVTLGEDEELGFTIDFDLRKSVLRAGPNFILKPVLRIVRDGQVGHIAGIVEAALLIDSSCADSDPDTGNAVYVFEGAGVTPDDIDGDAVEPVTTSLLEMGADGIYRYEIGFLPPGPYTVSFTCNADAELVDPREGGSVDNDLKFLGTLDVIVTDKTEQADLQ